jgi:hypothetical protein
LNYTRIDCSDVGTTVTANLAMVWFRPGPVPEATVQTRC